MNLNSRNMKLKGELSIRKYSADNRLIQELNVPNLVVTVGKQYVASRMAGTSSAVMSHMAIGSSATPPAATDTILSTETSRVAFAVGTHTVSGATLTYYGTFGPGAGTGQVAEAGIFNSATTNAGTMLCHTIFPTISKQVDETIVITWNVTVG